MHFSFEQGATYTIGELREFERRFLTDRQHDKALSDAWRVPSTPELKRWVKIREETYPIKLLADHKAYPDDATFQLKPFAFPGVDAEVNLGREQFNLQITIADPIWASDNAKIQHGGYDNRLPGKQTLRAIPRMSAKCQKRTSSLIRSRRRRVRAMKLER
jgi:hypothetical protein